MQDNKEFTKKLTDKGTFLSAIFTLTVIFMVIEFFAFGLLSLKGYSEIQVNSNQVIVYLNDLDNASKDALSKKLLELPGVSSIRYESKEIALKAAVKELGVAVNEEENPLNDAFFVYINKDVKLDQLKASLLNMSEISGLDFRTKVLEKNIEFSRGIDALSVKLVAIFTIVSLVMIYNIVSFSVKSRKKEIHDFLEEGINSKKLKRTFFVESVSIIFISTVLSFGIYQGIRRLLVNNIKQLIPGYALTISIFDEILIAVILFIGAIIISAIISFFAMNKYFKLNTLEKIISDEQPEQNGTLNDKTVEDEIIENEVKNEEKLEEIIEEKTNDEEINDAELLGEEDENIWEV